MKKTAVIVLLIALATGLRQASGRGHRAGGDGPKPAGHASPELKSWIEQQIKAGRNPAEVKAEAAQMGQRGIRRLDVAGLATRARLFLHLMENAPSVRDCAGIARGGSPAAVQAAMARVPQADREAWLTMTSAAVTAELRQTPPLPLDQQALRRAYVVISERVPAAQRQRFGKALVDLTSAHDEDACWAAKTLYAIALDMAPPHRQVVLRSLAE